LSLENVIAQGINIRIHFYVKLVPFAQKFCFVKYWRGRKMPYGSQEDTFLAFAREESKNVRYERRRFYFETKTTCARWQKATKVFFLKTKQFAVTLLYLLD